MNKQLTLIIIILFILANGCSTTKKLKKNPYKAYNYKQTHTQPHQHYSDRK
mgnify:CR=1 FL=1